MAWQHCILEFLMRISRDVEQVLDDLHDAELHRQLAPDSNSIAWLVWHLTRSLDRNVSEMAGQQQLWISAGWYAQFKRSPDPAETGFGHSAQTASAFRVPSGSLLLDYHRTVAERLRQYILSLSEAGLDRETYSPTLKNTVTVQRRLVGILSEGLQHVGQAAYVRGLLRGHGWLGH